MTKLLWLKSLLQEIHIQTPPLEKFYDNLGVVLLSANPVLHSKSKHFKHDLHFVSDNVQNHVVQLIHISDRFQVVDPLSKPVSLILPFFKYAINLRFPQSNSYLTISLREGVRQTVM